MAEFGTFDLGKIIATAEHIKSLRRDAENDKLRQAYLGQRETREAAQETRAATQFSQEQQLFNKRMLVVAGKAVAADPTTITQWGPRLKEAGIFAPETDFASVDQEQLRVEAGKIAQQHEAELQAFLGTDPRFAELDAQNQNRLAQLAAQQDFAREQGVTEFSRQKALAGVQHSNRMEEITTSGAQALERAALAVAAKSEAKKSVDAAAIHKTWKTYEEARRGLLGGLSASETGPIAGRVPAVTTAQQTAEGSVSAMAPVLKQIFRVAGEGVFTDRDQELLIRMVPTRTDTPAARKAKMENIDNIVRAKLGITTAAEEDPLGIR